MRISRTGLRTLCWGFKNPANAEAGSWPGVGGMTSGQWKLQAQDPGMNCNPVAPSELFWSVRRGDFAFRPAGLKRNRRLLHSHPPNGWALVNWRTASEGGPYKGRRNPRREDF